MGWINVEDRLPDGKNEESCISRTVFLETRQGIVMQAYYDYRYKRWFNLKGFIIPNPLQWEDYHLNN